MNTGWLCPRCTKSNAPSVKSCDCQPFTFTPLYTTAPVVRTYCGLCGQEIAFGVSHACYVGPYGVGMRPWE